MQKERCVLYRKVTTFDGINPVSERFPKLGRCVGDGIGATLRAALMLFGFDPTIG